MHEEGYDKKSEEVNIIILLVSTSRMSLAMRRRHCVRVSINIFE